MKTTAQVAGIIIGTMVLVKLIWFAFLGNSVTDIMLYDTYFVFDPWFSAALCSLLLVFLFSLTIGVFSRFSKETFNWSLFVSGFCIAAYFIFMYIRLQAL